MRIWILGSWPLAHVIAPEYSVFDNGALHSAVNPQLLVPLLALGISLGRGTRMSAGVAGAIWAAAFWAGAAFWGQPGNPLAGFGTPLAFMAAGAALMATGRLGMLLTACAAIIVGVYTGGIGRQEDPANGVAGWFTLGIGVGAALVLFFTSEAAAHYRPSWLNIPVRIVASWLLAIGVMFLGLTFKQPAASITTPPPATNGAVVDTSPCPGPHKHGLDGEFICLPVPTIDKAGTPSSIARFGNAPPVIEGAGERSGATGSP